MPVPPQEVMESAMASKQPVIVAYGNAALKTWETEGADVLRKLADQSFPHDTKHIQIFHVQHNDAVWFACSWLSVTVFACRRWIARARRTCAS
jgi:hypothetical protein